MYFFILKKDGLKIKKILGSRGNVSMLPSKINLIPKTLILKYF